MSLALFTTPLGSCSLAELRLCCGFLRLCAFVYVKYKDKEDGAADSVVYRDYDLS